VIQSCKKLPSSQEIVVRKTVDPLLRVAALHRWRSLVALTLISDGRNHYSRVPAGSAVPTLFSSPSTLSLSFWVDFSFTVVILMLPRFSLLRSSHHVLVTVFLIICVTTFTSGKETSQQQSFFILFFLPYPVG
jgi:hypothetical protein